MANRAIVLAAIALCALPALAPAQTTSILDRFTLRAGILDAGVDTLLRVDSTALGPGTRIDLENDLGLDSSDEILNVEAELVLGRRHMLSLDYFEVARTGSRVIDQPIEFGGQIFDVDARLDSAFDTEVLEFAYTFFPVIRPRFAFGLSFGVANLSADASLAARVDLGGIVIETRESATSDLPVPLVGLDLRFGLAPRLVLLARGSVFDVDDFEGWSGTAQRYGVALEHKTFRSLGFGVGWEVFDFDAVVDESELGGEIDYQVEGLEIYLRLGVR